MKIFGIVLFLITFGVFAQETPVAQEALPAPLAAAPAKALPKVYVVADLDPIGLTWQELGLETSASFVSPLTSSWVKWVAKSLPADTAEVVQCIDSCSDDFYSWLQIPQENGMQIPAQYADSSWMKISYKLRKLSFQAEANEWKFEWEGSVVLLDANSKQVISSFTILPENKSWRGLDQKGLNSALASSMYKSALDYLNKTALKLKESERGNRLSRLIIQGQSNVGDVISLMDLLKKEGSSLGLSLKLDVFGQKEAQLLCFYKGEEKSFTDLLSRLKELKSSQSYRLVNEFTGVHHVLKLVAP